MPQTPEIEEDGETYADNARKKALALARWSGLSTVADDSGLEVDALGGAPGVRSARYAGPRQDAAANRRKLLRALEGAGPNARTARFRCVIAVARPDGAVLQGEGTCEGMIATEERGRGGFGYDPVFFYPPANCTLAEMSETAKNRISHRARAIETLLPALQSFLDRPASDP